MPCKFARWCNVEHCYKPNVNFMSCGIKAKQNKIKEAENVSTVVEEQPISKKKTVGRKKKIILEETPLVDDIEEVVVDNSTDKE